MANEAKSLQELLGGDGDATLDPAILAATDLTLPDAFRLEALAEEMLEHLTTYHKAKAATTSARHSGDNQRATQMFQLQAYSRLAVAIIQNENPGVKAIADQIALSRAKRVKEQRAALLKED